MEAPVSTFVGLLLLAIGISIAVLIFLAVGVAWGDIEYVGEIYGNTRNVESNPYVMYIFFIVVILVTLSIFSDRIKIFLKKKFKKKLR